MKKKVASVSRRSFLGGAAALAAPALIRPSRVLSKSNTVTFTSYGGSYQEILIKNVFTPFTEETGIKVNLVPAPTLAKIKAQRLTGNVEWDIFLDAGATVAFGSKEGFWEELDPSLFDVEDLVAPPKKDSVTYDFYPGGTAWDPAKFDAGKYPANFADFFDVKRFPGRRAFSNRPNNVLEVALLADGVASKDMYPLDLDRAFKALDRIKPSVAAWVESTPQTISLVQTGEADFSYTFSNRVKATTEPGGGKPLAFSFEQNLIYPSDLAVLKGAPNKENALQLIAYFLRPEVQARLENQAANIPVSKKARNLLSTEARKWQPNLHDPKNLTSNSAYWADNYDAVSRRFKEWLLS
ncbi:ABC transporter substrate-binding protein [Bradyrhizobium sp. BR 1432]|uniref:ABC transporter substrate-binding protein n=1 Tax=Bradyrhizobium sp. BR 1432 TaxID=3447966 RepID=UPI003EE4B456